MLVTLVHVQAGLAADAQSLSPLDVAKIRAVRGVYPSPDGSQIAFVRSEPRTPADDPGSDYQNLFVVPASGGAERRLLGGKISVRGVSWSPDGRYVCFLDKRDGDKFTQVYGLPMDGGEPTPLTAAGVDISQYAWRADGKQIAYTAADSLPDADSEREDLGFEQVAFDEFYRCNSLHLWDIATSSSRRLTSNQHVNSFIWSPDGAKLAAAISPRSAVDDTYMSQRLFIVDPKEPTVEKLVDNPGKLGTYTFSPDGSKLAYISAADRRDPHAGMLYVIDVKNRQVQSLTDGLEGMVHEVVWLDTDKIVACLSRSVQTTLEALSLTDGQWQNASPLGPAFRGMKPLGSDGNRWVMAGSTATHPDEVLRYDGRWTRLTNSNPWLTSKKLGKQAIETITARDGLKFEGLLMYPVGFQAGTRYPLVIVAHGGPESHFSNGWNTSYGRWGQLLCARGYFAWLPNYRASTGRGVTFAKADHGDPMGREFEDHLDAIAEFNKRGLIDPQRVGVGGGSYGGYTAAWAATRHSEHFAAAVSFVPVVDLRTKWLCSDIPYEYYHVHYEEKWPHQQPKLLADRSPLTYAERCTTPLLLLGGTSDTRVHPSQPHMLYRAVQFATNTACRYIQYPGEGHGNRRNVYRYDFCVRTLRWFDHYLKPGDHRHDPLPPRNIDLSPWKAWKEEAQK
jgi:dipeptidyl aminopeptidase/acylaminoacyl peptidase